MALKMSKPPSSTNFSFLAISNKLCDTEAVRLIQKTLYRATNDWVLIMEHFAALELNNAEFLGDAVLEIEVASWLFRTYPDYSPNKMVQSLLTTLHT